MLGPWFLLAAVMDVRAQGKAIKLDVPFVL
jgi:hypothetical protein